ncbi:alpha/beta fold hydrolase [Chitinophaga qingshengii]|uniref:Alpha/beta fold hydrolase n=1 Tax=Chitinophaga qingshengii TaxID=1569794 RepID=A0ABR7TKP5_9BACT|nr:alpha/beta hydrolase [Chitinophaga qingshengii]MBC9930057.1 alpha/beta fold hydrolase [Chitinophaga qingshengii]
MTNETLTATTTTTGQQQYFITGDGVRIAYRIDGQEDKPVLVLSNSIATSYHMWDIQIDAFTPHFRILRFDTRGNGSSSAPDGDYSINRMALDVIELLDHLGLDRVHFMGLSLGGYIAQYLAIHAPERIDRLILAHTAPYLGPQDGFNNNIRSLREAPDMQAFARSFIHNWFPAALITAEDPRIQPFREMVLATSPVGLAGSFAAVRDGDLRNTISLIGRHTLIIGGKYDTVTLPEHSEQLAAAIKGSRLVMLPAVHLSNVELPEDFNRIVINFLQ